MPIDCTFEPVTSTEPLNFIRDDVSPQSGRDFLISMKENWQVIRQYLVDELPDGVRCTVCLVPSYLPLPADQKCFRLDGL